MNVTGEYEEAASDARSRSREPWHLSKAVPLSVIFFLIFQTIGIVIWATRLDFRVQTAENSIAIDKAAVDRAHDLQDRRITILEALQPKLAVIEARQSDVIKRLDANGDKLDKIVNGLLPPRQQ